MLKGGSSRCPLAVLANKSIVQASFLGDVPRDTGDPDGGATRVEEWPEPSDERLLTEPHLDRLDSAAQCQEKVPAVTLRIRMHFGGGQAERVFGPDPQWYARAFEKRKATLAIGRPEDHGHMGNDGLEPAPAGQEFLLSRHFDGDVAGDALDGREVSVAITNPNRSVLDVRVGSVAPPPTTDNG